MKFFIDMLEKVPLYSQLLLFFVFHWYQKMLRWLNSIFIKPLETIYEQYKPLEPTGHEWIQLYCLTKHHPFNEFGWNLSSYDHFEKVLYSHVDNFSAFVQKEHELIVDNPIIKLPYQYEFECQSNLVELLFVVRNGEDYAIRNFSGLKPRKNESWESFPKRSSFEFLFVEYYHPHMKGTIELTIPAGMYLVNNELFTPAHIHRMLYYTDRYFVFDLHYEIRFMDQNMEQHVLRSDEYLVITEDGYEYRTMSLDMDTDSNDSINTDDVNVDDVNVDHAESSSLGSSTEIVETESNKDDERTDSGDITDEISTSFAFWWPFVYKSSKEKEITKYE